MTCPSGGDASSSLCAPRAFSVTPRLAAGRRSRNACRKPCVEVSPNRSARGDRVLSGDRARRPTRSRNGQAHQNGVSNDTLLRTVRRRGASQASPPSVIGIDDWAWRRNFRYGTLICDLERRKTIAMLPDREPATAEAWLRQWRDIKVIARDRGGAYALAAQKALPGAVQVADRWHLMENASATFLDAVRKSMRPDPSGNRRGDHRSRATDCRRTATVRRLSAS